MTVLRFHAVADVTVAREETSRLFLGGRTTLACVLSVRMRHHYDTHDQ